MWPFGKDKEMALNDIAIDNAPVPRYANALILQMLDDDRGPITLCEDQPLPDFDLIARRFNTLSAAGDDAAFTLRYGRGLYRIDIDLEGQPPHRCIKISYKSTGDDLPAD